MADSFQFASDNPSPIHPTLPDRPVAVELPLEVAAAIAQRMEQSGQTQAQVILAALQLVLTQAQPPEPELASAELRSLKQRLADLEALIPRMVALEGKSIAF